MFNKDFYPTPEFLIQKLLQPYSRGYKNIALEGNILEPSAGKGDIINYILKNGSRSVIEIHAIEIEPELQNIIKGIEEENVALISEDFLNFKPDETYDYIIMNPPFSNAEDHLIKAYEISTQTNIACIVNAEMIKNPYSAKRKRIAQIIEENNGKIEFVKDSFINAERKTNVEVALIWLEVKKESDKFNFEYIKENDLDLDLDVEFNDSELMHNDYITNFIIRAEKVKKAYEEKLKADAKFKYYLEDFANDKYFSEDKYIKKNGSPEYKFNSLNKALKRVMWKRTINELNIERFMSSKITKNFDLFVGQQSKMAYNKENTYSFFKMIMQNRNSILQDSIVDVFDELTKNGYTENRMFIETWKTNSAYKVNKKVIAPSNIVYGSYCSTSDLKIYGSKFSIYNGYNYSFLTDLDKIMCSISGKDHRSTTSIYDTLDRKFKELGRIKTGDKFDSTCESTFFKIKFFKKGTIHLEFKDVELWKEFNFRACEKRNWIPNEEKKAHKTKYSETNKTNENYTLELI